MLQTKVRDTAHTHSRPGRPIDAAGQEGDQSRPEVVIVIGVVAIVSMAFGFVLGLLF